MDVMHSRPSYFGRADIAIISTTGLPEPVERPPCLVDLQLGKPYGSALLQKSDSQARNDLLDGLANVRNVIIRTARIEQHVHMLGHNDICPQIEFPFLPARLGLFAPPAH